LKVIELVSYMMRCNYEERAKVIEDWLNTVPLEEEKCVYVMVPKTAF
jgi:hypothetical protein